MASMMNKAQKGLGGPAGYGEISLPRSDDGSMRQDWSEIFGKGLHIFGKRYSEKDIYVNSNGTISFGRAYAEYPTQKNLAPDVDLIAVFWADIDTRLRGEGTESGAIYVDLDKGAGVVSITWDNVAFYRRDSSQLNRFQAQFVDRGNGDLDVILRYETIMWSQGSADDDAGARAGFAHHGKEFQPISTESHMLDLDIVSGNRGAPGVWVYEFRGGAINNPKPDHLTITGTAGADHLVGGTGNDTIYGLDGDDIIISNNGANWLYAGDGRDTIIGGAGDDFIFGGSSPLDLGDVIYGGAGNDVIDAGYGNDEVHAGEGDDSVLGGFGADTLIGHGGNDTLSGGPLGDLLFGGPGDDFLNGGFGHDRLNGGAGADQFYHLGIPDHGSDWIQDYQNAEGDTLVFGMPAKVGDFQLNYANTPNAGLPDIAEVFVIYRPTGKIIWALVDGAAEDSITIDLGGNLHDLLML